MDKYKVTMSDRALRDLDGIYEYIAKTLIEPGIALNLIDEIETGVLSLDTIPHRCSERKVGAYANRGYRQLFVKNYTILFRIDERKKTVVVVTVSYSSRQF
ncbi:MAG: type II toxin-antitoxin system RelE/ParE family toxin [Oscillospiraceae bacterium]|nr:type II toxin-antitoxin system RelE/ParE family toxin [Oscillospiraceae bacterium]